MNPVPTIPDFELVRPIGRGSYGEVWLARSVTGLWRAIKIVDRATFTDDRPFLREFDGIRRYQRAALGQPSQLALLHVGRDDAAGRFYYVMELADDASGAEEFDPQRYVALTLKELRTRRNWLPAGEVIRLGAQLARALALLHQHRLIHRDVKPSNIILVQGVPKLADVGLVSSSEATLSSVGTPGYAPPEGPGTQAADLYSLGKVLYELATGLAPTDFPRLPPDAPGRADAHDLAELNGVLLKVCARLPDQRYASAELLAQDLELLAAGRSVAAYEAARRRWRRLAQLAVVGTTAALVVAALLAWRNHAVERQRAETRAALYRAGLSVARSGLDQGDFRTARTALTAHEPAQGETDLRGFEWFALRDELRGDPATAFQLSRQPIRRMRTSPDGSMLIAENDAGELLEWQPAAQILRRLPAGGNVHAVANEGTRLVGISGGWGVVPAGQTNVTPLPGGRVLLDATPDAALGLLVDSAPTNFIFTLRRTVDGVPVRSVNVPKLGAFLAVAALSPEGSQVALELEREAGLERFRRLELWDLNRGVLRWRLNPTNRIHVARFSPDGRRLAVNFGGAALWLLDTRSGRLERTLAAHADRVTDFTFSPDGNSLVTAGADQTVRLWSVAEGTLRRAWRGHAAAVTAVGWITKGRFIVSADNDGVVRVWSPASVPRLREFTGARADIFGDVLFAPDGGQLLATMADNSVTRLATTSLLPAAPTLRAAFQPLGFDAPRGVLWSLDVTNGLREWAWPAGQLIQRTQLELVVTNSQPTALRADAGWLAMGFGTGAVQVWRMDSALPLAQEPLHQAQVSALAFSADGALLASASRDGDLRFSRLTAAPAPRLPAPPPAIIMSLAWSADRKWLAAGLQDGSVMLDNLSTGKRQLAAGIHVRSVDALAFSPDGRRLVSGGLDGQVIFWQPEPLVPLLRERPATRATAGGETGISSLRFSGNGDALAALTEDGRVVIWRAPRQ